MLFVLFVERKENKLNQLTAKKRFATISPNPEPATVAQLNFLYDLLSRRKMDVKLRHGLSKRQASRMIAELGGKAHVDIS